MKEVLCIGDRPRSLELRGPEGYWDATSRIKYPVVRSHTNSLCAVWLFGVKMSPLICCALAYPRFPGDSCDVDQSAMQVAPCEAAYACLVSIDKQEMHNLRAEFGTSK